MSAWTMFFSFFTYKFKDLSVAVLYYLSKQVLPFQKRVVKMLLKLLYLLLLSQFAFCDMLDQFKDMMDLSYECSTAISDDEKVEVLKTVDCSSPEARWDFRIIVSSNLLTMYTLF